jgi:beta-glucanase (GH16 family)
MTKKKNKKLLSKIKPGHIITALALLTSIPLGISFIEHQDQPQTNIAKADTPQPVGQTGNWNLVFTDDFNGTSLDTTKWSVCLPWYNSTTGCPGANSSEQELYMPDDVIVSNGILNLHAEKRTKTYNGKRYNYTSGLITTGGVEGSKSPQFSFTYGYMEMRARIPKGQGFWPAFWAVRSDYTWPPEIDSMEVLGNDPSTVYMTYHYVDNQGTNSQDGQSWTGPDLSADWHTYGVDWEPNAVHWYIDGIERRTAYTDAATISNKPMYLIANLAVGGSWPGNANATTPFPSDMQIDYIRVWQAQASPSTSPTTIATPIPTNIPTVVPTTTPLPTSTPTPTPVPQGNLIQNPSFETTGTNWLNPWSFKTVSGAKATISQDSKNKIDGSYAANISVTKSNTNPWYVQLMQGGININSGRIYTISFWAKASKNRAISVILQQNYSPYNEYLDQTVNLTTSWAQYNLTFVPSVSDTMLFSFNTAKATGNVWIDKVSIQ